MKILIIPSWYTHTYGGEIVGIYIKEQAIALAEAGFDVSIISVQEIGIKQLLKYKKNDFKNDFWIDKKVKIYRLQYLTFPALFTVKKIIKLFLFKRIFKQFLKREKKLPNLVHLHSFINGELAIWLKRKYKIPYLITEHSSTIKSNNLKISQENLARKVFEQSNYNIAVSEKLMSILKKKFDKIFHLVPNMVDCNLFIKSNSKRKQNEFHFVCVGMLRKIKNHDLLLKAFARAFENDPRAKLTIVGEGEERDRLEKLIVDLNLQSKVVLYGEANRPQLIEILQRSDAFVLASRSENLPLAMIEAMSCGLPLLITKSNGPEMLVPNEKIGILSEIDEDDLTKNLLKITQNKYDNEYIRDYTRSLFDNKVIIKKISSIYKTIVN